MVSTAVQLLWGEMACFFHFFPLTCKTAYQFLYQLTKVTVINSKTRLPHRALQPLLYKQQGSLLIYTSTYWQTQKSHKYSTGWDLYYVLEEFYQNFTKSKCETWLTYS